MDDEILSRLYLKVINYISYSPRSKKEILDKLDEYVSKEKIDDSEKPEYVEKTLDVVESEGYVDDYKLAEDFLSANFVSKNPKSKLQLKNKLYKKKLPPEIIDAVLNRVSPENEVDSALSILSKKVKNPGDRSSLLQRQKLIKYLLSKGFAYSSAKSAVDTLIGVK